MSLFKTKIQIFDDPDTKKGPVEQYNKLERNDFIFDKKVGEGCSGEIFRVFFKNDIKKQPLALKIISKEKIIENQQQKHVANEIKILKLIDHPFVIKLLNYFQDTESCYLVFEFLPGGDLKSLLNEKTQFKAAEARIYLSQVFLALRHLHTNDTIYRDLKTDNILIDSRGFIKLADFGFSKVSEDNRTYTLCGTPEYLAPEFLLNKEEGYGNSIDWWAYGILAYELVTG